MELDAPEAPAVYIDHNSHTCIVVKATAKHFFSVALDASGLVLKETPRGEFLRVYKPLEYPVAEAAAKYLAATEFVKDNMAAAVRQLDELAKDKRVRSALYRTGVLLLPEVKAPQVAAQSQALMETEMATAKKPAAGKAAATKKAAAPKKEAAKKPTTTAKKAEPAKKAAKAPAEKKARKPGVTAFITGLLQKGKETEEILMELRDAFPDSKAGKNEISWCRSQLKKAGAK